jgi:pilus assembly protein FimV
MICLPLTPTGPSRLLRRGAALMAGLLMSGLLMSGPSWAQANPPQTSRVTTTPGQTAADIALDHVPAGISFEQFLLALYRENPQTLIAGALQALPSGTTLMLPSAAQASAVAPDQARAQLLAMRRVPIPPASLQGQPMASPPQPAASQAQAPQDAASQAHMADAPATLPAPVARMPSASPAGASATGLPVDPLLIIFGGGALLVILLLVFRRPDQAPAAPTRPSSQTGARARQGPAPARPPTDPTASVQAPERLRPSLPLKPEPRRSEPAAPPAAPLAAPLGAGPAALGPSPPPAAPLTRLSELGPLPSLDLDSPASSAPTPGAPMKPQTAQVTQAGASAPAAPAAGPLDLSRISLDLREPPRS